MNAINTDPHQSTPTTDSRGTSDPASATAPNITDLGSGLTRRPGRWIDGWNPENDAQWESVGRPIARKNLRWSIFAEFLGFVVWQLWSVVVVALPTVGFTFSTAQTFWLISMPALVGATMRFPYTFMVAKFGGRNWTIVSALMLLIPTIALAVAVSNPNTSFTTMLIVAALAGFGGGNFASSMANITYFFPQKEKGWALGLNAAGGNLGASVAQFVVPIAITIGAVGAVNLGMAGLVWVPLIVIAAVGAALKMDNLSNAKSDFAGAIAAVKEPHMWVMAFLYIGTFGSFIGFTGTFPKLIADQYPAFTTPIHLFGATISLAFLGALTGSLSRPYGGKLSDRFGGARVTIVAFIVMGLAVATVAIFLPILSFWAFLGLFLLLFAAAGVGNGSTYRMIPTVFAWRGGSADAHNASGDMSSQRKAAASLGLISAIGAYGGFMIPQALSASATSTGSYQSGLGSFVVVYVIMIAVTFIVYVRGGKRAGITI